VASYLAGAVTPAECAAIESVTMAMSSLYLAGMAPSFKMRSASPCTSQRIADRGAGARGAMAAQEGRFPFSRVYRSATYALRECSRALLAGSKPALASCSRVAAGGDRWLLMAVRGHLGDTGP
jgi:hypothetical protein